MPRMPTAKWPLGHGYGSEITLRYYSYNMYLEQNGIEVRQKIHAE